MTRKNTFNFKKQKTYKTDTFTKNRVKQECEQYLKILVRVKFVSKNSVITEDRIRNIVFDTL